MELWLHPDGEYREEWPWFYHTERYHVDLDPEQEQALIDLVQELRGKGTEEEK